MGNNKQTNNLIKSLVVFADFILLNFLLILFAKYNPLMTDWHSDRVRAFILFVNLALLISQYYNSTIIHMRHVSAAEILRRITRLILFMVVVGYLLMKAMNLLFPVGYSLVALGVIYFVLILFTRFFERKVIKA